jgi:RsiW-degrading membrane proteinase PrsW (M82 family)
MDEEKDDLIYIKPHKLDLEEKLFFLISGVIVSIPITIFFGLFSQGLYTHIPLIYAPFLSLVIITPFVEEFAKAYPLFYRYSLSERSLFILALLVGFGFGLTELILYTFALGVPLYARIPGLFFHAATTSIVAYGIAKKKPLIFFILAVFLHASYNLFAIFDAFTMIFMISLITYLISILTYLRTTERYLEPE